MYFLSFKKKSERVVGIKVTRHRSHISETTRTVMFRVKLGTGRNSCKYARRGGSHLAGDGPGDAGVPRETDQSREWPSARVVAASRGEDRSENAGREGGRPVRRSRGSKKLLQTPPDGERVTIGLFFHSFARGGPRCPRSRGAMPSTTSPPGTRRRCCACCAR